MWNSVKLNYHHKCWSIANVHFSCLHNAVFIIIIKNVTHYIQHFFNVFGGSSTFRENRHPLSLSDFSWTLVHGLSYNWHAVWKQSCQSIFIISFCFVLIRNAQACVNSVCATTCHHDPQSPTDRGASGYFNFSFGSRNQNSAR